MPVDTNVLVEKIRKLLKPQIQLAPRNFDFVLVGAKEKKDDLTLQGQWTLLRVDSFTVEPNLFLWLPISTEPSDDLRDLLRKGDWYCIQDDDSVESLLHELVDAYRESLFMNPLSYLVQGFESIQEKD